MAKPYLGAISAWQVGSKYRSGRGNKGRNPQPGVCEMRGERFGILEDVLRRLIEQETT